MPLHVLKEYRTIKYHCGRIISSRRRKNPSSYSDWHFFFLSEQLLFSCWEYSQCRAKSGNLWDNSYVHIIARSTQDSLLDVCALPPSTDQWLLGGTSYLPSSCVVFPLCTMWENAMFGLLAIQIPCLDY